MVVKNFDDISKLLVFVPSWVGDAVMAAPTLRALRRRFAEAEIVLAGPPAALSVLADSDLADGAIIDQGKDGLRGFLRAVGSIKPRGFDAAILLSNSLRVAAESFLSRIPRRVGYIRDLRGGLLTDGLPAARESDGRFTVTPALEYYLAIADYMGCDVSDRAMTLGVGESFSDRAGDLFAESGIASGDTVVVINPGASFGSSKLWPAERFAAVADALSETRAAKIIINAAPGETAIARAVADAMRRAPAINFADRTNTLGLLKAIIARADLTITGDTGPRHVAAALGCAVVTIFGSTDPDWTTIDCPSERLVITDAPCAPCQEKTCPLPQGPGHHVCMKGISVERVLAAAEELLDARPVS